jgi:hypothetical protein
MRSAAAGVPILVRRGARAEDSGRRGAARSRASSADFAHPQVIVGPTAPRACRLRDGIRVKWPLADVPGWITTTRKSYATHRPALRRSWRTTFRRAAHPHPPAGGRGDGPRAAGGGTGDGIGLREAHRARRGLLHARRGGTLGSIPCAHPSRSWQRDLGVYYD